MSRPQCENCLGPTDEDCQILCVTCTDVLRAFRMKYKHAVLGLINHGYPGAGQVTTGDDRAEWQRRVAAVLRAAEKADLE